ncbi:MAG: DUF4139 domain-containing protein [Sedimentisphaerales bacterium]|nr:DUF4139 domain-containing protein [Sedimentisphaerales bacterium]
MRHRILFLLAAVLVAGSSCFGAAEPGVGLTIYNDNFAVVREARKMKFEKGKNTMRFTDVASAIDPTSVKFTCLSSPGAVSVLEQNYEYDLVNADSLLKRYIDKEVMVAVKGSGSDARKFVEGTLLAAVGPDLIVKSDSGIEVIGRAGVEEIALKELPDDLVTRPTLVWLVQSEKSGEQLAEVAYTTGAIGWKADYTAVLNADDTALDFSGWVTIDNHSGAGYKDATLKLIAGDVRRIQPAMELGRVYTKRVAMDLEEAGGFAEKAFMEYHMYTLGRKSTINNNQVKQIEFIEPAEGVKAKKIFVYEYEGWNWWQASRSPQPIKGKVNIKIEFENKKENKMGIALPKGKVRVFKNDPADNSLQFVGEDEIDHTPKDEKLSLYIGNAFDIVAERIMTDDKTQWGRRYVTNKIEIRNRKEEPVTVFVDEKMPHIDWKIEKSTHKYEKRAAYAMRVAVEADVNTPAVLEYTVSWPWPY